MPLKSGRIEKTILLLPRFCSLLKACKCLGKLGGIIVKESVRVPTPEKCTSGASLVSFSGLELERSSR